MTGFSSQWLDLREPIDHAARSEAVISALCHYFLNDWKLVITDIGCGTGSTLRALKPFFDKELTWHLIDNDPLLLEEARKHAGENRVESSLLDLSTNLDPVFTPKPDLVTTSAFLDLVSADWLAGFVEAITQRELPFYAALSYDGRGGTTPAHGDEAEVLSAFNAHQRTDKGLGPALGPDAADTAIRLFEEAGYIICREDSDWVAGPKHPLFQTMLLDGWRDAATQMRPQSEPAIRRWHTDRMQRIEAGELDVRVGHKDFFAVPPA